MTTARRRRSDRWDAYDARAVAGTPLHATRDRKRHWLLYGASARIHRIRQRAGGLGGAF